MKRNLIKQYFCPRFTSLSLSVTGYFIIWSSVIPSLAFAQNASIAVQHQHFQLAQIPDLSRPIEKKVRVPGGTVVAGFRYNPQTKDISILVSGDLLIKPIIEKQPEQRPKYTKYNRVTISNFKYNGIDVGNREIRVEAKARYQKLTDKPWPLSGRFTTFDQSANIRLGANFEVNNRRLEAKTYVRKFDPGWASGPLGFVLSAFDALTGVATWASSGEFTTLSEMTGTLGATYINLAQPQKELVNSMFNEVNKWNSEGLIFLSRTDYDQDGMWLSFQTDQNQVGRLWSRLGNLMGIYFPGVTVDSQLNLISSAPATPGRVIVRTRPVEPSPTNNLSSNDIKNTSQYIGQNGESLWDWTIYIDADPSTLSQIECVQYTLHPTFSDPVQKICDNNKFAFSARGHGTFVVGVKILFKNGESQMLSHELIFQK
jgi:YEATS family